MVKKLVISLFLFLSFAMAGLSQSVTVKGKLDNLSESQKIYIFKLFGPQLQLFDSVKVKNNTFSFVYPQGLPRGFYKIGLDTKNNFPIVLGKENINLTGSLKQPLEIKYEQSKENAVFQKFARFNQLMQQQNQALITEARQLGPSNSAADLQSIMQQKFDSLKNAQQNFYKSLHDNYPDLFMGKISKLFVNQPGQNEENFFSEEELTDIEFTNGDMLLGKIYRYYQLYAGQNVEKWLLIGDRLIAKTEPKSKHREVIYLSLVNLFASGAPENLWDITSKYGAEFPNSRHYQYLRSLLPPPPLKIGDIAPEISLPDENGKMRTLSSLKGNYVLVDFWASWCGPCRKENPNVVNAYNKYKNHSFTVLGVSLDKSKDKWLEAIQKDQLNWAHISDLKGWKSVGAASYQVRSIPASFLVDPQGKIVAKNLRGAALESTLEKLLIKK